MKYLAIALLAIVLIGGGETIPFVGLDSSQAQAGLRKSCRHRCGHRPVRRILRRASRPVAALRQRLSSGTCHGPTCAVGDASTK